MPTTVSLGQLFLLRRDLKKEIEELDCVLPYLAFYREDKPKPEEDFEEKFQELSTMRSLLLSYDNKIEKANSAQGTVAFKDTQMSLNDARHLKTHLTGIYGSLSNLIARIDGQSKREERETEYDMTTTPPLQKLVMKKYLIIPDLKKLKSECKSIKTDIQLLDSAIQKCDWETMLSI